MTMRASMVRSSIPTNATRTYASITIPLSRITSMTSASPLGRGRSMYPRGVAAIVIFRLASFALPSLGLVRLVRWEVVLLAHQVLPDICPVSSQRLRNPDLVDAVQVADRPIELLQGILRRSAVAVRLGPP